MSVICDENTGQSGNARPCCKEQCGIYVRNGDTQKYNISNSNGRGAVECSTVCEADHAADASVLLTVTKTIHNKSADTLNPLAKKNHDYAWKSNVNKITMLDLLSK